MYTDRSNKETSEKLKWTKKVHTEGTNKEKTVTSNIIYRILGSSNNTIRWVQLGSSKRGAGQPKKNLKSRLMSWPDPSLTWQ